MDPDVEYAGGLYGLTPVVISATLGRSGPPPLPIPITMPPPPSAAKAIPSPGLGGGTDLGVVSLPTEIVLDEEAKGVPRPLLDGGWAMGGPLNLGTEEDDAIVLE